MPRPRLFALTAAAIGSFIAAGALLIFAHGLPNRFPAKARDYEAQGAASDLQSYFACAEPLVSQGAYCGFGTGARTFLLWGDSHAAALIPAFEQLADRYGASGYIAVRTGCPATVSPPGPLSSSHQRECYEVTRRVAERIKEDRSIRTIILAANWRSYRVGREQLEQLVSQFPNRQIIILDDNPVPGFDVPWALALAERSGQSIQPIPEPAPNRELQLPNHPNVRVINLSLAMCRGGLCPPALNGQALYHDKDHVSEFATRHVIAPFLAPRLGLN
jgi:hypothetical protein